tara:strand:+ start:447 stop:995 length:549 start_codon:yes stop_codon:yes gene_type:complete
MENKEERIESFYDAVDDEAVRLEEATENNDELMYLMLGSMGRMAQIFKSGKKSPKELYEQCVAVAAACTCIAINEDSVEEVFHGEISTSFFFTYKHHSENMTKVLDAWIEVNMPDGFHHWRCCGTDRTGKYLIGLFDADDEVLGFITSPNEQIRNGCKKHLGYTYPNPDIIVHDEGNSCIDT